MKKKQILFLLAQQNKSFHQCYNNQKIFSRNFLLFDLKVIEMSKILFGRLLATYLKNILNNLLELPQTNMGA